MLKKDNFSPPEIEEKVLEHWKSQGIFQKSLDKNKGGKEFVFYEGPPTANGKPALHHFLARAFKDIIPRYKTMSGFYTPRQAGWDTHGLPVELALEKELGLKNKKEIEDYGIDKFNAKAKELVWSNLQDWGQFTERIGYWVDQENPYITYENDYIESLFWVFSQIYKKGHLKKLQRTVPWCWRCQTPLSSHELGQPGVYQTKKDASLYFKVKLKNEDAFLLVWTTTPWTLPGNLAVALDPKLSYSKFEVTKTETGAKELLYSYNEPPEKEGFTVKKTEEVKGANLLNKEYEPLFDLGKKRKEALQGVDLYKTRQGEFIETETGTGFVHIAPSFGEDDYALMGINDGLPVTITDNARMEEGFPGAGKYIKDADADVVQDLDARGLLYKFGKEKHEYPHCWRCDSPLVYMVRRSWFIQMSKLSDKLVKGNEKINWEPEYIKEGRFGNWLKNIKDWSISRNRYWGTPLPIWQTKDGKETRVISSLKDFQKYAPHKNTYYLTRHTEARHNVEGLVAAGEERDQETTSELTDKGLEQAKKLAQKAKKEGVQHIYASPYKRTKDTADIIAKELGLKVIVDKRIAELEAGVLSWKKIDDFHSFYKNKNDRFIKAPEGGENWNDLRERTMKFYGEIDKRHEGEKVMVVSHGDVLWMLHGAIQGWSDEQLLNSEYYPGHTKWEKLESSNLPFDAKGKLDLHRPYIDKIELVAKNGEKMKRVEDVADVWFDSGAMPYASKHFPFSTKKADLKNIAFPAEYISEAVDQTRGWFYTLHAIANLLGKPQAYKNVICLGLLRDKHGKKMSKSKGNVIVPSEIISKYGADAIRWYFYTVNDPGEPKNFNEDDLAKVVRKVNFIIYNSFAFLQTYGSKSKDLSSVKNQLDKWVLSQLYQLVDEVTENLNNYKIGYAARSIEAFIDDLSRWYIRRSRSRFQDAAKGQNQQELDSASATLHHCLVTLSKLMAPFMPFFADALYQSLDGGMESVHLEDWPKVDKKRVDEELSKDMASLRQAAAAALALRAKHQIKVRQPLTSLTVKDGRLEKKEELLNILADEVNVKSIIFDAKLKAEEGVELDLVITPELKKEGLLRELARAVQGLRQDAKYDMADQIQLYIATENAEAKEAFELQISQLKTLVNAKSVEMKKTEHFDAEKETKISGTHVWIGVKKI